MLIFDSHDKRHGLKQKKLIRLLFVWVACGFVGTELCLFLACRPFVQYWAVPPSSSVFPPILSPSPADLVFNPLTQMKNSPMCYLPTLRNHRSHFQHQLRYHDAPHRRPPPPLGPASPAAKSGPPHRLRHGHLRHRGRHPDQDLLPRPQPDLLHLPQLVLPRSLRLHLRHQPARALVPCPRPLPPAPQLGLRLEEIPRLRQQPAVAVVHLPRQLRRASAPSAAVQPPGQRPASGPEPEPEPRTQS